MNEIIDSMISDLNNLLKNMAAGQYIRVCSITMEIVQKLTGLKEEIKTANNSLEEKIDNLKRLNNELAEKAFGAPVIEETEENGNGTD